MNLQIGQSTTWKKSVNYSIAGTRKIILGNTVILFPYSRLRFCICRRRGLLQRCQEANLSVGAVSTGEGARRCHPSSSLTGASGGDVPLLCGTGSSATIAHSRLVSTVTTSQTWIFKQISLGFLCIKGTTAGQKWPQALSHQSSFFLLFCKRASAEEPWEGTGNGHGHKRKLFWTSGIESALVPNREDQVLHLQSTSTLV